MIIANSLGSNYTSQDIKLSLSLLFQPWRWQNGKEIERLKNKITEMVEGSDLAERSDPYRVQLFYKGRQAIAEALRVLNIGAGDEVIVQAFTCVAVIKPILESGATPVYVDVAPKSLNPPLSSIKTVASSKTKAIILQHTLGYINEENDNIVSWCKDRNIYVIQDLAHAFSLTPKPTTNNQQLITSADAVILSFSQDKVVDGISGGALILPNNSISDANHNSLQLINLLINWSNFMIAKTLLYPLLTMLVRTTYQTGLGKIIHFVAKEFRLMQSPINAPTKPLAMPNALAALALNQFRRLDEISRHRQQISLLYDKLLHSKLKMVDKSHILSATNLRYPIWVSNRNDLEKKLIAKGFYLMDHWYDSPIAPKRIDPKEVKYTPGSCPNAEELSKHIFNLPTHINISAAQAEVLSDLVNRYAE